MANQQMNGEPVPAAVNAANTAELMLHNTILAMVHGLIQVNMPSIPPDAVLRMIAFHLGLASSQMVTADLGTVLRLRSDLKDAYAKGVDKAKMNLAVPPQAQAPSRKIV